MLKVAVVVGSTRPNRRGLAVAQWALEFASRRSDAEFELVDVADFHLPLLDEPMPASQGNYAHAHTRAWSARIAPFDAFIFVTPEYNHSAPPSLTNALDFLYQEWHNKAAGFVSYGSSASGARAVEHLRGIMAELQIADVRGQVALSLFTDWEKFQAFTPGSHHEKGFTAMLDQLVAWGGAMKKLRN